MKITIKFMEALVYTFLLVGILRMIFLAIFVHELLKIPSKGKKIFISFLF